MYINFISPRITTAALSVTSSRYTILILSEISDPLFVPVHSQWNIQCSCFYFLQFRVAYHSTFLSFGMVMSSQYYFISWVNTGNTPTFTLASNNQLLLKPKKHSTKLTFSMRILSPFSASILLISIVSFKVILNWLPPSKESKSY